MVLSKAAKNAHKFFDSNIVCYSQNEDSLILLLVGKLNFQPVEF